MSSTYTYTFLAKDLMSTKLATIAGYGKRMGSDIESANNRVQRSSRQTENSISSLQKIASRWIAGFATIESFKGITNLGFNAEATRVKFETLLGSTEAAKNMLENLDSFANKTPFENADLHQNAQLLLNFGIAGSKVLPTLKMLGDVSSGNKDTLNSLSLAYAQVSSTGKLMGQDLLQMINAGFNPLQIISEKTGRSLSSLKDDMSKGKIGADMVEEAFRIATSEGGRFYGMMDKISQTGVGKMSTFFGTLKSKLAKWSENALTPIVSKVFDFGTEVVNGFSIVSNAVTKLIQPFKPLWSALHELFNKLLGFNNATFTADSFLNGLTKAIEFIAFPIEVFITGLTQLIKWLQPFSGIIKVLAIGYGIWTVAQWALNTAMNANPIIRIVSGIALLVGAIMIAYEKVGWFRGGILAAWEILKGFGTAIKEYVLDRIQQMVKGITGIGQTLMHFFKGDWKKAWETGKEAAKNLTGIGVGNGSKFAETMKASGKMAGLAYNKGVAEANANNKKGSIFDIITDKTDEETVKGDGSGGLGDVLGKGITDITGGGQRQTNITVSFEKLVENFNVNTQTFEQGMDESLDSLKKMMLRVLNSANQMQTSPT